MAGEEVAGQEPASLFLFFFYCGELDPSPPRRLGKRSPCRRILSPHGFQTGPKGTVALTLLQRGDGEGRGGARPQQIKEDWHPINSGLGLGTAVWRELPFSFSLTRSVAGSDLKPGQQQMTEELALDGP